MKLDPNEKKVLNVLLYEGNASNHKISKVVGIHHQTVAKIRKKLEKKLELEYTVKFDYNKAGIDSIYYMYVKIKPTGMHEKIRQIARKYQDQRPEYVGYGSVSHAYWDGYSMIVCTPNEFDHILREHKRELGKYIQEMLIIKHSYVIGSYLRLYDGLRRYIGKKL